MLVIGRPNARGIIGWGWGGGSREPAMSSGSTQAILGVTDDAVSIGDQRR